MQVRALCTLTNNSKRPNLRCHCAHWQPKCLMNLSILFSRAVSRSSIALVLPMPPPPPPLPLDPVELLTDAAGAAEAIDACLTGAGVGAAAATGAAATGAPPAAALAAAASLFFRIISANPPPLPPPAAAGGPIPGILSSFFAAGAADAPPPPPSNTAPAPFTTEVSLVSTFFKPFPALCKQL